MSNARRRTVKALVVLGSVLAFLSIVAIWTERQALDTDEWVATSDDLIADETIRAAVADYLVDQLYENVDIEQELEGILPDDIKDLAGPASGGLRQVAGEGAERVLETSTAQTLWQEANRTAHEELVLVLEDEKEGVSTEDGEVTLDLAALVTNLAQEVGIGAELAEQLPEGAGQVTILRSDELKTAQDIAAGVKGLALVLSLLTFLSFGLAIWLSRGGRWVTVLFSGIGLIAAGFATIVAREVAGGVVIDQLVDEESIRPAAESAWAISTSLMTSIAETVIVVGVLFGIAGWLGSPTDSARSARRFLAPFLRNHVPYVYAGLAVLVGVYFLAAPTQSLRSLLTTLAIAGLAALGINELRKQTEEEFPDAKLDDYFGGAKRAVTGAVKSANIGERASKLRLPEKRRAGEEDEGGEDRPAAAPPPPADAKDSEEARLRHLERLADLRDKGVLTDEEFAAEKTRLLGGGTDS